MPPARRVFREGPNFLAGLSFRESNPIEDDDDDDFNRPPEMVEAVSKVMRSAIPKRGKRRSKKQHYATDPHYLIEKLPQPAPDALMDNSPANDFDIDTNDFDDMTPSSPNLSDDDDILPSFGPQLTLDDANDDDDANLPLDNIVDLADLETEKVRVLDKIRGTQVLIRGINRSGLWRNGQAFLMYSYMSCIGETPTCLPPSSAHAVRSPSMLLRAIAAWTVRLTTTAVRLVSSKITQPSHSTTPR